MSQDFKQIVKSLIAGIVTAIAVNLLGIPLLYKIIVTLVVWLGTFILTMPGPKVEEKEEFTFEEYMAYTDQAIKELQGIAKEIEDVDLVRNIREISVKISQIKEALEKNPQKFYSNRKTFSYYIPATLSLVRKYDEIENQHLTSKDSREYMKKVRSIFEMLNKAYQNMLNSIYSSDILDQTADIEVLNTFLKMENTEEALVSEK